MRLGLGWGNVSFITEAAVTKADAYLHPHYTVRGKPRR